MGARRSAGNDTLVSFYHSKLKNVKAIKDLWGDRLYSFLSPFVIDDILEEIEGKEKKKVDETTKKIIEKMVWDQHVDKLRDNQRVVREIVNNFFQKQTLKSEHLDWLNKLSDRYSRYAFMCIDPEKMTEIHPDEYDLNVSKMIVSDAEYGSNLVLPSFYKKIHTGLLDLLTKKERSIKQCANCGKVMTVPLVGLVKKYCSDPCKTAFYRKKNAK